MAEKYDEYHALHPRSRKCLPATNFWLIAAGREPIAVPPEDKHYHKYFTEKQREHALKIWADRQTGFLKMVVIKIPEPKVATSKVIDAPVIPREKMEEPPARRKSSSTKPPTSLF
jgi:hypothetical protein